MAPDDWKWPLAINNRHFIVRIFFLLSFNEEIIVLSAGISDACH